MAGSSAAPASPISDSLRCPACHMLANSSASFSGHATCKKCRLIANLEARIGELENHIHTLDQISKQLVAEPLVNCVDAPADCTVSATMTAPSQQGDSPWVTVRGARPKRKQPVGPVSPGSKSKRRKPTANHQPIHVSNRFSPLARETEKPATLVIGASTIRNVMLATPSAIVKSISWARANDIESNLKVLAKANRKYSKIVIHTGTNDVRLRQSEITIQNFISECRFVQQMSDSVTFSGPIPIKRGDEMLSRISDLNRWLSKWCAKNNVGFIDNFSSFWGKPGLLKRDGIHPTWEGTALLSRNIDRHLTEASS
ncbi:uncharacterized protein LOC143131664 [Alosa pseudoharengus]|uniref:uncharacterized protein LOC143131664 n=1 Tax=Alosa pseudoharengus TaxID=34774 RepID=UPI003F8CA24C